MEGRARVELGSASEARWCVAALATRARETGATARPAPPPRQRQRLDTRGGDVGMARQRQGAVRHAAGKEKEKRATDPLSRQRLGLRLHPGLRLHARLVLDA